MGRSFSKNSRREIKNSLGRFLAILSITALGVGFFSGLCICKKDMIATADRYIRGVEFFDYRAVSTLGWSEDDLRAAGRLDFIDKVVGEKAADFMCEEKNGGVIHAMSITGDLNKVELRAGRMPESDNECLADIIGFSKSKIGAKVTLSKDNSESTFDAFEYDEYTIVGIATTPQYMSFERGTASIGSGSVSSYILIPEGGFSQDYYSSIYVTIDGEHPQVYSDDYNDFIEAYEDNLQTSMEARADIRYRDIVDEANTKIADAEKELADGWEKFHDGEQELADGWDEYNEQKAKIDKELADARQKIIDGQKQLEDSKKMLSSNQAELTSALDTVNGYISEIESALSGYGINYSDPAAAKAQLGIALQYGMIDEATYNQLIGTLTQLETLYASRSQIKAGLDQIDQGWYSWDYAAAQLEKAHNDYTEGREKAEKEFSDALQELEDAEAELEDARTELEDGESELADAKQELENLSEPKVFILNRNTVTGYYTFEGNSEIVAGVSKVFPIFFFAVAALVCSTTMNRMVVEQRTQIGVFKALGYSRARIISKYLSYAGIASVVGWAIGFFGGSWLFPTIIWRVYNIMFHFSPQSEILFDPLLGVLSLAASLLCSMGVTYVTCRRSLSEVPAELMRPKGPESGARLFLEKIGFIWNHLGFLTKVSLRNIIRYKKRLLMMVLGVGGCTALLITGFGIRDSIQDIVGAQYNEIFLYDISASMSDPVTDKIKTDFINDTELDESQVMFVYTGSIDVTVNNKTSTTNIMVSPVSLDGFVDLHSDTKSVSFPGKGEAVVCNGLAETLGLHVGDTFSYLTPDSDKITVTVSGICINYVYNYIYVNSETYEEQTGTAPRAKTALVTAGDEDHHMLGARISKADNVTSVNVNLNAVNSVGSMLQSLDYIVILVIACAAALAFIVLYNLTNINIKEREREIATIKVLGFYATETANYVFKENIILSVIGAAVGLGLGKLLHWYVMSCIKIDLMHFPVRVTNISMIISFFLTIIFAVVINTAMIGKIQKINMAESLKSVE